jgi:uncharacterized protein (TIGR04222 family)
MSIVDTTHWPLSWRERWQRIAAHRFDDPEAPLPFTLRLAREHGWSRADALAALEEYRRFCFLAVTAGREVTPSDAVDEVWHLHLTCTRDYWQRWCADALGTPLHHEPTRGTRDDAQRHAAQYADTLAAYERCFGPPPEHWWPGTRECFRAPARWQRVDRERAFVIARPRLRTLGAMLALVALAPRALAALPANPLDWTAGPFLALYAATIVAAALLAAITRLRLRESGSGSAAGRGGSGHGRDALAFGAPDRGHGRPHGEGPAVEPLAIAYLGGGERRAVDTALTELLARGTLVLDPRRKRFSIEGSLSDLSPQLASFARLATEGLHAVSGAAEVHFAPIRKELERRGLILTHERASVIALWAALPLFLATGLGLAKMMIGIERGKPVGFLVLMTLAVFIAALVVAFRRPLRTRAGDRAFAQLRARHARAARAPRAGDEAALAVALVGTAVLSGTAYAHFHTLRHPPSSGSDSSGCSGGNGDGGGGGGCGGCGGGGD